MKRFGLFVLLLAVAVTAQAQSNKKNVQLNAPRPKVGVVLGGGGAKGASHIGVLKYIEEMGIPVDYVAGTSMGSILGGLYAMGYTPDELTKLISNMDWSGYIGNKIDRSTMSLESRERNSTTLINIPFSLQGLFEKNSDKKFISLLPSAYVNNSSLVNLFNNLCVGYQEDMDFNDLPIPFACVATNIVTGEEVVLRSGSVPTAMRASMAIPGVFSPVTIDDMVLVDGGLVNNFPADVLKAMGADIIIGVEVTSEKKITREDIQSLPQLLGRLVINSTSGKRKENRELCNIHIIPDVSGFGMLSFTPEAIDTLVGRGYKKAAEYHDQLLAIKESLEKNAGHPVGKELRAPKAKNLATDSIMLASIEINGVTERQSRWLIRKGEIKPEKKLVQKDIEKAIDIFRGTGCFDEITYDIKEANLTDDASQGPHSDLYNLNINLKPASPHVIGVGMRYDTEEGAAILLNFGLNEKKFGGSKLNFSAKLSYNPKINVTYTYSRSSLANFSLAYDYRDEHFAYLLAENGKINLHYHQHKFSGYISQFHLLNFSASAGISYVNTHFDKSSLNDYDFFDSLVFRNNRMITPCVNLKYDNLDDAYFATHGIDARLSSKLFIEPKSQDPLPFDINYAFSSYISPGKGKFTIIPQIYGRFLFNGNYCFNMWSHIGGEIDGRHFEQQMPFIGFTTLRNVSPYTTILRCDLRYNIIGKHYITAMYNYLFEWYTDFHLYSSFDTGHGAGLKYSYNSLIGPISLTGQWSTLTHQLGVYFSIGYTF